MPNNSRPDWHERVAAVDLEFQVARAAVAHYTREVDAGRVRVPDPLDRADLSRTADGLPATYLVRLFAVFEAALRSYWTSLGRTTQPPATDLLNGVAARRQIPFAVLAAAHVVREERNRLVHETGGTAVTLTVGDARQRLQQLLARLPEHW